MFVLLMVPIITVVLRFVLKEYGELFAGIVTGIILMLVSFAGSWGSLLMVCTLLTNISFVIFLKRFICN